MVKTKTEKQIAKDKMEGKLALFWAAVKIYQPFIFGGDVWQFKRYPVIGREVTLGDRAGFVWKREDRYRVHDSWTGCYICDGEKVEAAVWRATKLLQITPDFARQASDIGSATTFPLIEYDEAMRLLEKNKEDDVKREKEFDRLIKEADDAAGNSKGRNKRRATRTRRVAQKNR